MRPSINSLIQSIDRHWVLRVWLTLRQELETRRWIREMHQVYREIETGQVYREIKTWNSQKNMQSTCGETKVNSGLHYDFVSPRHFCFHRLLLSNTDTHRHTQAHTHRHTHTHAHTVKKIYFVTVSIKMKNNSNWLT